MAKQMQPRNSNLRELPVAPGNADMNSGPPASNARPVVKVTQGLRPGQSAQPVPVGGRGRGHIAAKPEMQPGAEGGGGAFRKEAQSTQPSTAPQVSPLVCLRELPVRGEVIGDCGKSTIEN